MTGAAPSPSRSPGSSSGSGRLVRVGAVLELDRIRHAVVTIVVVARVTEMIAREHGAVVRRWRAAARHVRLVVEEVGVAVLLQWIRNIGAVVERVPLAIAVAIGFEWVRPLIADVRIAAGITDCSGQLMREGAICAPPSPSANTGRERRHR